ncbi:hypothetical protein RRG08_035052 [Elysia crispata]|uniref:Uncharacterized protein n=1 Tax=Elysia crispata TaxID=231223 RepID=A0AAE0ZS64_9GAST|nr:hypothetical protein RRG08_035052 [Elysia crispata]
MDLAETVNTGEIFCSLLFQAQTNTESSGFAARDQGRGVVRVERGCKPRTLKFSRNHTFIKFKQRRQPSFNDQDKHNTELVHTIRGDSRTRGIPAPADPPEPELRK